MTSVGLVLVVFSYYTGPGPDVLAAREDAGTATLTFAAVQVTHEGRRERYVDQSLASLKDALLEEKRLAGFDTFQRIKSEDQVVRVGQEVKFTVDSRYTLYVKPAYIDGENRVCIEARIEETLPLRDGQEKPEVRKALETKSLVPPTRHLVLGGLKRESGQLVVVVKVVNVARENA